MRSRPVVSNTSPLINLAGIGCLELLPQLYDTIWIPDIVLAEYQAKIAPDDPDLRAASWLAIQTIATTLLPDDGLQMLGPGEAATIRLAQTSNAQLIILDDKSARNAARDRGLVVVGTLGVLLAAKQLGLLPSIREKLQALMAQGRRISPALRDQALRAAGEEATSDETNQ
jgi:uncharacterized protein